MDDTCTDEGLIGRVDNHALDFCLCQRIDCEEQRNDQEKYFLHLVIKVKLKMCVCVVCHYVCVDDTKIMIVLHKYTTIRRKKRDF